MGRYNARFAEWFRDWLREQGLSGLAAAFKAHLLVSATTVNKWQRGEEPNDPELFEEFCRRVSGTVPSGWRELLLTPAAA